MCDIGAKDHGLLAGQMSESSVVNLRINAAELHVDPESSVSRCF
jgi:hypothetical protein